MEWEVSEEAIFNYQATLQSSEYHRRTINHRRGFLENYCYNPIIFHCTFTLVTSLKGEDCRSRREEDIELGFIRKGKKQFLKK